jgi:hypothetical protein
MQIKIVMIENKSYKIFCLGKKTEKACKNIGVASRTKLRFSFAKSIFFHFIFASGVFTTLGRRKGQWIRMIFSEIFGLFSFNSIFFFKFYFYRFNNFSTHSIPLKTLRIVHTKDMKKKKWKANEIIRCKIISDYDAKAEIRSPWHVFMREIAFPPGVHIKLHLHHIFFFCLLHGDE